MTAFRFGSFVVDRARYRVLRDGVPVALTPKLLDLLLHLLDHAGTLVTKEELLEALWPGANVTDNALAQAMSELRQALGDNPATPQYIKTVARRGYRFIAAVTPVDAAAPALTPPRPPAQEPVDREPSVFVLDFVNVTNDDNVAWMAAGIAETVTADLRATGQFRVVDRLRVKEAERRGDGSLRAVALDLDTPLAVAGSYQLHGDRIRITARMVDTATGDTRAQAKVDGPLTDIFALQDQVVSQFARDLGLVGPQGGARGLRETPSLEAYRAHTEAWLRLETLDLREIPEALAGFQRAIAIDPRYGSACTGLANAELVMYEATRTANAPARERLEQAVIHARRGVALDPDHAEGYATLAHVLVSTSDIDEARRMARHAVALEPSNWRHHFRLGHATWGSERLEAARRTLSLYPDFAFAHFQAAMVHVARQDLREAEAVLRQGAAVQDRQLARGDRFPALGLHWLLALVRLAHHDAEEALRELAREEAFAEPHRVYGHEYRVSTAQARGLCLLELRRYDDAIEAFRAALAAFPDHAQSLMGLSVAMDARGLAHEARSAMDRVADVIDQLTGTRPVEAAMVDAQRLAVAGQTDAACARLRRLLDEAPPGYAGWTMPIEPLLRQAIDSGALAPALKQLAERA